MGPRLKQRTFQAMGTACALAVTCEPGDEGAAGRALDAARLEVAACETALSRFDPASDLSLLNRADGRWVAVGHRLMSALSAAVEARAATAGRFDPTILPALVAAGYDRSYHLLEERAATAPAGWRPGAAIELDWDAGLARLERGAAADLGGIGKGWSAGRTIAAMRRAWPSLAGALVDLGGDIEVCGVPPGGGAWLIDIADPSRPGVRLERIRLAAGGIATSGRDTRRFGPGRTLHHLIDPATGVPAEAGPLAVTVVADNAADAEAHATALAITPLPDVAAYVRARPRLAALVVPATGAPIRCGALRLAAERHRVRINLATPIGDLR